MQIKNAKLAGISGNMGGAAVANWRFDPRAGEVTRGRRREDRTMNVAQWLASSARLHPQAPALLTGTTVQADYKTLRAAPRPSVLASYAITAFSPATASRCSCRITQYLECMYAVWWIGAVVIPINAKLHGREAAWICDNAGARLAFVDDDSRSRARSGRGRPADRHADAVHR